ncbi:unnamed protein product [Pylaiella littoralis]
MEGGLETPDRGEGGGIRRGAPTRGHPTRSAHALREHAGDGSGTGYQQATGHPGTPVCPHSRWPRDPQKSHGGNGKAMLGTWGPEPRTSRGFSNELKPKRATRRRLRVRGIQGSNNVDGDRCRKSCYRARPLQKIFMCGPVPASPDLRTSFSRPSRLTRRLPPLRPHESCCEPAQELSCPRRMETGTYITGSGSSLCCRSYLHRRRCE